MCNLYSNRTVPENMRRLFGVPPERDHLGNHEPQPAIFPRYEAPIARKDGEGRRELVRAHWGFVLPQVSKKTSKPIMPKAINNARDDKLRNSGFWRESFEKRRCLIPATSFCEAKGRQPAVYHWFAVEGDEDRPPFAFAGIWRPYRGRYKDELVEIDTYSMVTSTPNELVKPIHPDRMPIILDPADHAAWMDGGSDEAFELLRPFPAERMRVVLRGENARSNLPGEGVLGS